MDDLSNEKKSSPRRLFRAGRVHKIIFSREVETLKSAWMQFQVVVCSLLEFLLTKISATETYVSGFSSVTSQSQRQDER